VFHICLISQRRRRSQNLNQQTYQTKLILIHENQNGIQEISLQGGRSYVKVLPSPKRQAGQKDTETGVCMIHRRGSPFTSGFG